MTQPKCEICGEKLIHGLFGYWRNTITYFCKDKNCNEGME